MWLERPWRGAHCRRPGPAWRRGAVIDDQCEPWSQQRPQLFAGSRREITGQKVLLTVEQARRERHANAQVPNSGVGVQVRKHANHVRSHGWDRGAGMVGWQAWDRLARQRPGGSWPCWLPPRQSKSRLFKHANLGVSQFRATMKDRAVGGLIPASPQYARSRTLACRAAASQATIITNRAANAR